jgi:hypothetical protein
LGPATEKEEKMKKVIPSIGIISVMILLLLPTLRVSAASYDSVVTGKTDPNQDVKAVQDAVNKGGAVLLKGTFDFGIEGRVNIKNDIKVFGETDSQGKPLTRINRGHWTFYSPLPSRESPPEAPGPKIAIRGIHFDGAVWTPMHFPYTSGAVISGNKITNVLPSQLRQTLWVHAGALFGTRFINREKILPGTTGHLLFENNEVDLKCDNPKITMGQGAFFIWTWGAIIEIRGNTFANVSRNTIETLDNYLDEQGRGTVIITDNRIITPADGCPFPSPITYPNGIVVGWFLDRSGAADPKRNSKILIMNNYVETNSELASGIVLLGEGTLVLGNKIVMKGGSKSRGIARYGPNSFVARNKIE